MRQLNKAEQFALQISQSGVNEAQSRLNQLLSQHSELLQSCGLDTTRNYSILPDGTVSEVAVPDLIPEDPAIAAPIQVGKPL